VIEGGVAGSNALQLASQRRSTAERLATEAAWLERVAADLRLMAGQLDNLPPAYAVLHDLTLPGSKGTVDHMVVGPGGAFLVVTRRYADAISFRDGHLWAGQHQLHGDLDTARVEATLMTQLLGSPVVPVLAFLDAVLPAAAPQAIDGVLVCSGATVTRVITRASHTLLTSPQVADVVERALPLLHSPGTVVRAVSAKGVSADPAPDTSVRPVMPHEDPRIAMRASAGERLPQPPPDEDDEEVPAGRRRHLALGRRRQRGTPRADAVDAVDGAGGAGGGADAAVGAPATAAASAVAAPAAAPVPQPAAMPAAAPRPAADPGTSMLPATRAAGDRPHRPWMRSLRTVAVAIAVLSVVGLAVGTLSHVVWSNWIDGPADTAATGATDPPGSAVDGAAVTTIPLGGVDGEGALQGQVPEPHFTPICPGGGAGWTLDPMWPGNLPGVVSYDVELGQVDGSWTWMGTLTGPADPADPTPQAASLRGLPASTVWTVRLVAVDSEGGRTVGPPAAVAAPPQGC